MNRSSNRLTTNAVESVTRIGPLRSGFASAKAVARAASSVSRPRTISTSGITATGLKKWNPTTRSGCCSPSAIADTDSEDVLVASTASAATCFSSSPKT